MSKDDILTTLRAVQMEKTDMPDLDQLERDSLHYANPQEQFKKALKKAGGEVVEVPEGVDTAVVIDSLRHGGNTPVVKATFGVCENGAVWIQQQSDDRSEMFLPEALIVRLDKNRLVQNMHEAYRYTDVGPYGYGLFMDGPSKTADIESALVFGAHGPHYVTVVLE